MEDFTYLGCYVRYDGNHPKLYGKWEAYKDDTFVGRAQTKKEMKQMKQRAGVSREKDFHIKEKMIYGKLKQLYREIDMVQTIYPESPNTMGFKEVKKPQKGDIVRPCNARDNNFDEIIEKVSWWNNKITYESGRWVSDTQLYQLQLHGTLEIIKATEKQNQA